MNPAITGLSIQRGILHKRQNIKVQPDRFQSFQQSALCDFLFYRPFNAHKSIDLPWRAHN
jgi:hypothetical protein